MVVSTPRAFLFRLESSAASAAFSSSSACCCSCAAPGADAHMSVVLVSAPLSCHETHVHNSAPLAIQRDDSFAAASCGLSCR